MNFYYYADENDRVIRVRHYNRPSEKNIPKRGTWVVYELNKGKWEMPCFPEITWPTINKLLFLGSWKCD